MGAPSEEEESEEEDQWNRMTLDVNKQMKDERATKQREQKEFFNKLKQTEYKFKLQGYYIKPEN